MLKRLLIFAACIMLLTLVLGILPIHGEAELYDSVVRLHVLANSDSEDDQALKLAVRDAVLQKTEELFLSCKSKAEAEKVIGESIELIDNVATQTVKDAGYSYPVSVTLGKEHYPTRNYESCCFPAGEYMSLRILIGEAEGQNWWCVLFPPMCLSAAGEGGEAFAQVGLNGEQYNIITETDSPRYKIRFKLLEVIEKTVKG